MCYDMIRLHIYLSLFLILCIYNCQKRNPETYGNSFVLNKITYSSSPSVSQTYDLVLITFQVLEEKIIGGISVFHLLSG